MKIDLVGRRFEKLVVVSQAKTRRKRGPLYWNCLCDCGNQKEVMGGNLKYGKVKSCGCLNGARTHGFRTKAQTIFEKKFYASWANMKSRCFRKRDMHYADYGGRGITVCEKWLRFAGFKEDMWDSYVDHITDHGPMQTSIDRIDVNGNYQKENCRWATNKVQLFNRRKFKKREVPGVQLF